MLVIPTVALITCYSFERAIKCLFGCWETLLQGKAFCCVFALIVVIQLCFVGSNEKRRHADLALDAIAVGLHLGLGLGVILVLGVFHFLCIVTITLGC